MRKIMKRKTQPPPTQISCNEGFRVLGRVHGLYICLEGVRTGEGV
jgi:hypothetical protein